MKRTVLLQLLFISALTFLVNSPLLAQQQYSIQLGPDEIGYNEAFNITLIMKNGIIRDYDGFPDIPGFIKQGQSTAQSTNIVNGRASSTYAITQSYVATGQGKWALAPFTITANGVKVKSPGKTIKVGPAKKRPRSNTYGSGRFGGNDPFNDFFGGSNQPIEYTEIEDDAFLALTTDKKEIYKGEGVTATLAFYVADDNRAPLTWYRVSEQREQMVEELTPQNVWEEKYKIDNLYGEEVQVSGKTYTRYKLYQSTFFPLNTDSLHFPSVSLKLIKYLVAKRRPVFGPSRKEDFKTYYTRPRTVKVKPLPPHPLRDKVAVGRFKLFEKLNPQELQTGQSFEYAFTVAGIGNISTIPEVEPIQTENFDFYPPNTATDVNTGNDRISGNKTSTFLGIPNEPGEYNLGDYFSMIYFDTKKQEYDTLRSSYVVNVTGESKKDRAISSSDLGSFYDRIPLENNTLRSQTQRENLNIFVIVFILVMLSLTAYITLRK